MRDIAQQSALSGNQRFNSLRHAIEIAGQVGNLIASAFSLWLVREARAIGAPWHVTARMLANVALEGAVGMVPVAGDAFDVMFRANMRNMRILRQWVDRQPR